MRSLPVPAVVAVLMGALLALAAPAARGRSARGADAAGGADGAGFGGAGLEGGAEGGADGAPLEDGCVVRGDDGIWRTCADVVQAKERSQREAAPPEDEEVRALRERMRAAEDGAGAGPPPAPQKTRVEIEIEKARLDPETPLLAVRIEVARAEQALKVLEDGGRGGPERLEAEKALSFARVILDDVERIALHRMDVCSQRLGNKPLFRSFRMTAGGAVPLGINDLMAQLPVVDPAGCERIYLVDATTVERVRRVHALKKILKTQTFGYHEVGERKALEKELAALHKELARDAVPLLSAPGVRDPY
jgi:hypothetical protein